MQTQNTEGRRDTGKGGAVNKPRERRGQTEETTARAAQAASKPAAAQAAVLRRGELDACLLEWCPLKC